MEVEGLLRIGFLAHVRSVFRNYYQGRCYNDFNGKTVPANIDMPDSVCFHICVIVLSLAQRYHDISQTLLLANLKLKKSNDSVYAMATEIRRAFCITKGFHTSERNMSNLIKCSMRASFILEYHKHHILSLESLICIPHIVPLSPSSHHSISFYTPTNERGTGLLVMTLPLGVLGVDIWQNVWNVIHDIITYDASRCYMCVLLPSAYMKRMNTYTTD